MTKEEKSTNSGARHVEFQSVLTGTSGSDLLSSGGGARLVFSNHSLVHVYDVDEQRIVCSMKGHARKVTCLAVVDSCFPLSRIVSGSLDGSVRLWKWCKSDFTQLSVVQTSGEEMIKCSCDELQLHSHSHSPPHTHTLFVAALTRSSHLLVWKNETNERYEHSHFTVLHKQRFESRQKPLCLQLRTCHFQNRYFVVIVIGHADGHIRVLCACIQNIERDDDVKFSYEKEKERIETFHIVATIRGHDDWIRSLAFCRVASSTQHGQASETEQMSWLLCSASQDHTVRLWRWNWMARSHGEPLSSSNRLHSGHYIKFDPFWESVLIFESLLVGHEHWVMDVKVDWPRVSSPVERSTRKSVSMLPEFQEVWILTSSMDNSVIVWRHEEVPITQRTDDEASLNYDPEATSSLWYVSSRLGDVNVSLHSVGLLGACFSANCKEITAYSFTGALQSWRLSSAFTAPLPRYAVYNNVPILTGFAGPVRDCSWSSDPNAKYLIAVGQDQTTRLYAPVTFKPGHLCRWLELARPQIHGHDLSHISMLSGAPSHRFVSAATEKVLRIFIAPTPFLRNLQTFTGTRIADEDLNDPKRPSARAHLVELGLTNRGAQNGDSLVQNRDTASRQDVNDEDDQDFTTAAASSTSMRVAVSGQSSEFMQPPTDAELASLSLWPEYEKLFGLYHDPTSLASSEDGRWIAASSPGESSHAPIVIFDATDGQLVARYVAHTSEVYSLAFSTDSTLLLAASRDRTFSLTAMSPIQDCPKNEHEFSPVLLVPSIRVQAHSRLIWCVAWSQLDATLFATSSRDKTVKFWKLDHNQNDNSMNVKCVQTLNKLSAPATAIAFSSCYVDGQLMHECALGLEDGELLLLRSLRVEIPLFEIVEHVESKWAPAARVNRLVYQPYPNFHTDQDCDSLSKCCQTWSRLLAVCSDDHTLRIYEVQA